MANYREIYRERLPTIHLNGFISALRGYELTQTKANLFKAVYHGVHFANMFDEKTEPSVKFGLFELVNASISLLTPRELMQIFPPTKIYDGHKWQTKDYYSTIEAVSKWGIDKPIGTNVLNFLWDYVCRTMTSYAANYMCSANAAYRQQTGRDMTKEFFESVGTVKPPGVQDGWKLRKCKR